MTIRKSTVVSWAVAIVSSSAVALYLGFSLLYGDSSEFLLGDVSHGHHQIELACDSCHGEPFAGQKAIQQACERCHGAELKAVDDSHPRKKFLDPRNADRLNQLDALQCKTCHREHKPGITAKMGVTLPADFCSRCHDDVAEERPSHSDLAFNSCASAGCHNYHDNRALYEDFLVKHAGEAATKPSPAVLQRDFSVVYRKLVPGSAEPLQKNDHDAPVELALSGAIEEWAASTHAEAGINCSGCHRPQADNSVSPAWVKRPEHAVCQRCHAHEVDGFVSGKHGMRLAVKLSPLNVAQAKLPMHADASGAVLDCQACHGSHQFDTKKAAIDACLSCHDDEHSNAFKQSAHYRHWLKAERGDIAPEQGVSCASCHLPRMHGGFRGEPVVQVQHNQNDTLRPNEKMIRSVCLDCHGLAFSLDALADAELVKRNFSGRPASHVPSIDWAMRREKEKGKDNKG